MTRVVELTPDDADAAVALWQQAGLTRPWNDPGDDFGLAIATRDSAVLGIRDDGALVATVMVGIDGHRGWMYYLAVDEAHRREGLGRALVASAEAWIVEHGAPKAQLMVRGENRAAVGFYASLGYEQQDVVVLGRRLG